MKAPCKDCPKRKIGCHGTCNKYRDYRAFWDEVNAKRKKENELRYFCYAVHSARFA